jgi:hypothetical protein
MKVKDVSFKEKSKFSAKNILESTLFSLSSLQIETEAKLLKSPKILKLAIMPYKLIARLKQATFSTNCSEYKSKRVYKDFLRYSEYPYFLMSSEESKGRK